MPTNLFSRFVTIFNRIVDVISTGSFERNRIMREFNIVFKEAYDFGELDKLCSVTTCPGNETFRHELSAFYLRSGFKITIHNDASLYEENYLEISRYVIESAALVRQLMALGYDTLIIIGKNTRRGIQIPLKEIANLHSYMLKNR